MNELDFDACKKEWEEIKKVYIKPDWMKDGSGDFRPFHEFVDDFFPHLSELFRRRNASKIRFLDNMKGAKKVKPKEGRD